MNDKRQWFLAFIPNLKKIKAQLDNMPPEEFIGRYFWTTMLIGSIIGALFIYLLAYFMNL